MENERLIYLLRQHQSALLSPAEKAELRDWLADDANRAVFVDFVSARMLEDADRMEYLDVLWQPVLDTVLRQDRGLSADGEQAFRTAGRKPVIYRQARWLAVAAVLLLAVTGVYLLVNHQYRQPAIVQQPDITHDVLAPAQATAVITLADGRQVVLDSSGQGTLAREGDMQIVKRANGQIAYAGDAARPGPATRPGQGPGKERPGSVATLTYNTLTVPRGSRVVQLQLADGSKVWLNSGSSLHYPVAFAGRQRVVDVTGEVYFEIARDPSSPFIVRKDSLRVEVLGTHFNINAYTDEKDIRVTLLEGGVRVLAKGGSRILHPGQQALAGGTLQVLTGVDTSAVLAWKNGLFQFGDATDVATIMRQLARWYDVEVEYKGGATRHIGGTISRNVNISKVLSMLEMTDAVHFRIEGRKVVVLP